MIEIKSDDCVPMKVTNKKGRYFLQSGVYSLCQFDISLLPIKFNLPMVSKPLDWSSALNSSHEPRYLSDLKGGYLSGLTGNLDKRHRMLSLENINQFYINLVGIDHKKLCNVMNKLQGQPFQINSEWLDTILKREKEFVDIGLLMPKYLLGVDINQLSILLRKLYMNDHSIKKYYSYNSFLQMMHKNLDRARYENMILNIALAYKGYQFYLPVFLDFRGRIYRSGILHFHERDLARRKKIMS